MFPKTKMRTCFICRKKDYKYNLIRFVVDKYGKIIFDEKQKIQCRGNYVCKTKCLDVLKKNETKIISKILHIRSRKQR